MPLPASSLVLEWRRRHHQGQDEAVKTFPPQQTVLSLFDFMIDTIASLVRRMEELNAASTPEDVCTDGSLGKFLLDIRQPYK
jgi:hypothetical protein